MISFLYLLPGRVGVEDWQERKHKEDDPWVATPSFSSWYPKKGDRHLVGKQCFQIVWDLGVKFF